MKYLLGTAAMAVSIAFAAPAFAQESAPGTSVQTGAAASNSMSGKNAMASDSSMPNGSMAASHSMKKKKHTTAMNSSDSANGVVNKNDMSNQPGTKSNGN